MHMDSDELIAGDGCFAILLHIFADAANEARVHSRCVEVVWKVRTALS